MSKSYANNPRNEDFFGGNVSVASLIAEAAGGRIHVIKESAAAVADGTSIDLIISTPADKEICLVGIDFSGGNTPWNAVLYEDPTFTGGSLNSFKNKKRSSSFVALTKLIDGVTVTVEGTELEPAVFGGAAAGQGNRNSSIGGALAFPYWFLKADSFYLIRITNNTGNAEDVFMDLYIREEDLS